MATTQLDVGQNGADTAQKLIDEAEDVLASFLDEQVRSKRAFNL
jgi:hypothetical protein